MRRKRAGFKTCPDLLEFSDPRANKADALTKFYEAHKIDLSEVIAFGNTSNDNEMIQAAGLAYVYEMAVTIQKLSPMWLQNKLAMIKNIREWRWTLKTSWELRTGWQMPGIHRFDDLVAVPLMDSSVRLVSLWCIKNIEGHRLFIILFTKNEKNLKLVNRTSII